MALRYTAGFEQYDARSNTYADIDIEIDDILYSGDPSELTLSGNPLTIDYSNTGDNKLEPLRGSQATLNFVATNDFALEDLYTDQEMQFIVTIIRDGVIMWKGYIIPDGCFERFVEPPYVVTVRAIDGLGILKDIDFTDDIQYTGQSDIFTIIRRCLSYTGLDFNINTYAKLRYDGQLNGTDVLTQVRVWNERFLSQNDDENPIPMKCGEVIEAILTEWVAMVVQHEGEWIIVRIPDIIRDDMVFYSYDSNGVFIGQKTLNPSMSLGIHGESSDVIHVNNDQTKGNDFPYKQVTVSYEYGDLRSAISRQTRYMYSESPLSFNFWGWEKMNGIIATPKNQFDANALPYAIIQPQPWSAPPTESTPRISMKNAVTFRPGTNAKLRIDYASRNPYPAIVFSLRLSRPDGFFYWNTSTKEFQSAFIGWQLGSPAPYGQVTHVDVSFQIPAEGGDINVLIYPNRFAANEDAMQTHIYQVLLQSLPPDRGVLTEKRTAINNANYSTVPDAIEVHTGESEFDQYLGTMFKADGTTPTDGFYRNGSVTKLPFLRIASEDILYQHGRPMRKYEGTIYGYFNYFSIFEISNLPGMYMATSLKYDIKRNETSAVLIEISNEAISHTVRTEYRFEQSREGDISGT